MKDKVRIKSFAKGLLLQLDPKVPFEEILSEIASKFSEGRAFFGKESVALSFAGRKLSDEEEFQLMEKIQENCDLRILCILEKDESRNKTFVKALKLTEIRRFHEIDMEEEVQIFRGSLKDGEELQTPCSIVIFGDVEWGCSITSEKNILVMGALNGIARAGAEKNRKAFVVAMEMAPQALAIGDFNFEPIKRTKWGRKYKELPLVAKVRGDSIVMEAFTKEHLKDF